MSGTSCLELPLLNVRNWTENPLMTSSNIRSCRVAIELAMNRSTRSFSDELSRTIMRSSQSLKVHHSAQATLAIY